MDISALIAAVHTVVEGGGGIPTKLLVQPIVHLHEVRGAFIRAEPKNVPEHAEEVGLFTMLPLVHPTNCSVLTGFVLVA